MSIAPGTSIVLHQMRVPVFAAALLLVSVPIAAIAPAGQAASPEASELRCIPIEQALSPFGLPTSQDPRHIIRVGMDESSLVYSAAVPSEATDAGKTVDFTLTIKNTGSTPAVFSFSTAQRYDVVIWNDDCMEVWRWSRGRMFAQAITSLSVPAGGTTVFHIPWDQRDQTGHRVRVAAYESRLVFLGRRAKRSTPLVLSPLVFAVR
ncbi:MAG TPA: BsuPI-related putative proteinase inhibitor [bacterium]|nr:BsuPI-related putative proteinase inhibitor [bacterium]